MWDCDGQEIIHSPRLLSERLSWAANSLFKGDTRYVLADVVHNLPENVVKQGFSDTSLIYGIEETEKRARNEEQQKKQEAEYDEERTARLKQQYYQRSNAPRA